VYIAIDLLLILLFAGILAARGLRWLRRGQAEGGRVVQRELASWFDRLLDGVDNLETSPRTDESREPVA
jgi:hypothetical protein